MSNRLFQGVIHQMRDSIDRTIGVIDESSVIIACSELGKIGEVTESVTAEDIASQAAFVSGNYTYKSFGSRPRPEYAVFVSGNDPEAAKYVGLLAVSLNSIKQYYDEKYDRSNFIKNVILDNILPGDIYLKSRELRFNSDVSRVCMLIKVTNQTDVSAYDVVQNLFPDKNKDFVIKMSHAGRFQSRAERQRLVYHAKPVSGKHGAARFDFGHEPRVRGGKPEGGQRR